MNRFSRWADMTPISEALDLVPRNLRRRVSHTHWVVGGDPIFLGLHDITTTEDGRSYRGTSHFVPQERAVDRHPTIVFTEHASPWTNVLVAVHELGHVLHETLDWEPLLMPVDEYAERDHYEAFACAFTNWVWRRPAVMPILPDAAQFFAELAV